MCSDMVLNTGQMSAFSISRAVKLVEVVQCLENNKDDVC